ncbi:hypothetical protein TNCV_5015431 [Trichonephila clavipes]|nr:hypothetical protein TNCV_5015431 [Trichonephila clavipes]
MSSSPVPLNTRRVGQRCTLNLLRAETSSRWGCGLVFYHCIPQKLVSLLSAAPNRWIPIAAESRRMWAGVPQGSVLSPLLFLIFMNTIHHHIHSVTKITCYADDIAVWHSHNDITESEKGPLIPKNPPKNTCFELELLRSCSKKEDPATLRQKGLETIEILSQDNCAIAYTDGSSDRSLSNGGAGILLLLLDVTEFDCPRNITSTIARLRTERLKGMKIHPDKTRSCVQCKHCPDLQLTPNHVLECPTVATKLLKMGMVPQRDSLWEIMYSPDAPRIAEAVIKTLDGI